MGRLIAVVAVAAGLVVGGCTSDAETGESSTTPTSLTPLSIVATATSVPPTAVATTQSSVTVAATTGPTAAPGTLPPTLPDPNECIEGRYTIQEDDTARILVAEKFDVTVAALDAANANTAGYGMFFPGLEIVIPC